MLSIFSCICWLSVCLLWRNVCLGLPLIFFIELFILLILSYMSYLYILRINPLSVATFANIFSNSFEGCLFILLMVSFAIQKLLSLTGPHLFIFAFISLLQEVGQKGLAVIYVRVFCLCLPLRVLQCLDLQKVWNASQISVILHRGHANLLCMVPILVYALLK